MKTRPLKRYAEPAFPTRAILDANPELLRLVPKRWRGNRVVLTALATACMIIWGCRDGARAKDGSKPPPAAVSRVAPIFQHGDGRGAFGCVVVNPPVFLSEDEARQVIVEEAKKAHIMLTADSQTLPDVPVPVTNGWALLPQPTAPGRESIPKGRTKNVPLVLDGSEKKRRVAYEFVSEADLRAWGPKTPQPTLVGTYDIIGAARLLRDGLVEATPAGAYAVLYDPTIGYQDAQKHAKDPVTGEPQQLNWEEARAEAKKIAQEELRKQVRDFVAWLKAQGVI